MEVNAKTATPHTQTKRSDAAARTSPGDGKFAQIFKNATRPANATPIVPASATLTQQAPARSTFFIQNMPLEQRRSAVEYEGFNPQPAALEPTKGAGGRVLLQNVVSGG